MDRSSVWLRTPSHIQAFRGGCASKSAWPFSGGDFATERRIIKLGALACDTREAHTNSSELLRYSDDAGLLRCLHDWGLVW